MVTDMLLNLPKEELFRLLYESSILTTRLNEAKHLLPIHPQPG